MTPARDIQRLIDIMAALRTPVTGCPWDLEQSFETIVPFTIEETYEVADAVDRGDREDLRDELGDLLLQVVFQSRIAEEERSFDFGDVVEAITAKLIRRHPHIFGSRRDLTADEVKQLWGRIKAEEKAERARRRPGEAERREATTLGRVPIGLPPLPRAVALQAAASKVGFDWNDARLVLDKIREEADEVAAALDDLSPPAVGNGDDGRGRQAVAAEIGDLMFAVVNLARHVGVDPDQALRGANRKFERRFGAVETALARQGRSPSEADLTEMERLWQLAKAAEPDQAQAHAPGSIAADT